MKTSLASISIFLTSERKNVKDGLLLKLNGNTDAQCRNVRSHMEVKGVSICI